MQQRIALADARGLLGWSQPQLERAAGLTRGTVGDIESGRNKNPSYQVVMSIFRALQRGGLNGVALEQIFPLPPAPPKPRKGAERRVAARRSGLERRSKEAA